MLVFRRRGVSMFRPCIDLHDGKVKQIVGSTLTDGDDAPATNFVSEHPSAWFADLYRDDDLRGGHVIQLGPGNADAAREALAAWPGGLQIGGGVTVDNAREWLDVGASHVIVTSWVFHDGRLDEERLALLVDAVGKSRLVLDLSCRRVDDRYLVATDRWQNLTDVEVDGATLSRLSESCDEFLVHAVDVEGKQQGVDLRLIEMLGRLSPIPVTYAGGARSIDDLRRVDEAGAGRVDLTIGSALDIFGGSLKYSDVIDYCRSR